MKKRMFSIALVLALCFALAAPAFAAGEGDGIVPPETVTITGITAQEAPAMIEGGWWLKRVYCESGATVSLKATYTDSAAQEEIAVDDATITQVDSIEVFYNDPYLCASIAQTYLEENKPLKPGDSARPLKDGEWLIEVTAEKGDACLPVEYIYVQVGGAPADPDTTERGFTDVQDTDWFAKPVAWAVEQKITTGTTDTTFSPDQECTVAQILTFLWRAAGSPEAKAVEGIDASQYYAGAAAWAVENGLIEADGLASELTYPCTRVRAVQFIWAAADQPKAASPASFDDIPAGTEYADPVAWAVEKGVTTGTSPTTFGPVAICNRGHIVTFLYRAFAE